MNQDQLAQTPLSLSTICTISKSLESIITELYGPHGYKVLLSTATGHVTVTNDSACISNSLHLSHPIAKFIVQSLQNTLSVTVDSGKTFILYLSDILDGIRHEFQLDSRRECSEELKTNRITKTKVARLLYLFLRDVFPGISWKFQEYLIMRDKVRKIPDVTETSHFRGLIRGVISPHFTSKLTNFFTDIIYEMLNGQSNDLSSMLCLMSDYFYIFHCKVLNQPYTSSRCIDTMIIQRDFTIYCDSLIKKPVRFVLCQFSMSVQAKDQLAREIISIRSESKATQFIVHQLEKLKTFLDHCIMEEVSLVISSEKFPDYSLHLFRERNISLIHCVLDEDIDFLKLVTKRQAMLDISENIDSRLNIARAKSCSSLDVRTRWVHLNIGEHVPKSLIISAPTDGLCSNTALIIHKTIKYLLFASKASSQTDSAIQRETTTDNLSNLKTVDKMDGLIIGNHHSSLNRSEYVQVKEDADVQTKQESRESITEKTSSLLGHIREFAPGGGTIEFIIAKVLGELSEECTDFDMKVICKIIQNAVLRIPKVLHWNNSSCSLSEKSREFHKLQMIVFKKLEEGDILGLNRRGQLTNMLNEDVLESVNCKFYILSSVIQILIQLLRTDSVIGVKRIK